MDTPSLPPWRAQTSCHWMGAPSDLWATVWTTISRGDDATGKRELDQLIARDRSQATHGMTKAGLTLLHQAASSGCAECARVLLEHGAEPSHTSRKGNQSPLHWAAIRNHPEVARVLLDADADASILNADNDTPLKVALDNGNLDVALVLDPSRTEEVWQHGLFHLGLMPPAPPVSARSAAGSGPRPAKATRPDAARDPALWDLLRTLKAHDKESRLLRKLLEQTHGLGSSADRLGTALQQQLRAAEDSSRKLRRLLDASGDIGDVGQGRVLSTS